MAENLGEVKVKITVDSDEFKKGAAEVEQSLDDLEGATSDVSVESEHLERALFDVGKAAEQAIKGNATGAVNQLKNAAIDAAKGVGEIGVQVSTVVGSSAIVGVLSSFAAFFLGLIPIVVSVGRAIWNWVKTIGEAKREMIAMAGRVAEANMAIEQSGVAAAGSVTKFKLLAEQWKNLTPEDKIQEFDNYKKALKNLGIAVTNINDADRVFINQSDEVIRALVARAKAAGAEKLIAEAEEKKMLAQIEREKKQKLLDFYQNASDVLGGGGRSAASDFSLAVVDEEQKQRLKDDIAKIDKEISKHETFINRITETYTAAANGAKALGEFASEAVKKNGKAAQEAIKGIEQEIPPVIGSLDELNEALKKARENYGKAATDEMRQYYAAEIAGIEEAIDALEREAEAYLKVQQRAALGTIAPATGSINMQDLIGSNYGIGELPAMETPAAVLKLQNAIREANEAMQLEAERWNETLNSMFGHTVADSISGGIEAITDAIMGVGDIDATSAVDAFLSPFADMSVRLGEMMVAMGVAESAFLSGFNPAQKIAAGVALIALGKLYKSAVESAGKNTGSTASANSNSWTGGGQLAAATNTPLQIEVYGTLSGQDIVLAGNNYMNNQRR